MTLLNKLKNEQDRQLQIQAQLAEQSYRAFNGVKQSRENERSGELRKKMNDDLPASSLTKDMIQEYQREQEEEDFYEDKGATYKYRPSGATEDLIDLTFLPPETNLPGLSRGARDHDLEDEGKKRDKLIKTRNDKLKEIEKINKKLTELEQYKAKAVSSSAILVLNARITYQESAKKTLIDDLKKIDEKISNSTSRIKQIEDNLKLNENRVIDAEQKNKQIVQKYEEGFNLANKNRYQVKQQPNETDEEYIKRIQSLEMMPFDRTIFQERAATQNMLKLQKNLKELVRNEIIIGEIVRHYSTNPEAVFLINSNWKKILPMLLQMTGYNNKNVTAEQFANSIDYVISFLVDPQPRINITNITPPGTTPAGAPTTPPPTPARAPGTPARAPATPAGAPATPAGAATSASTSGWWPSGWGGWGTSGTTGTLSSPSLPSTLTIQVKNDPKTIHIYNSVLKNNLFIKIGESGRSKLRKIMYSKTTDSKGEYKAINFTNVRTTTSVHGFKNVLNHVGISLNDTTYEQVFGSDVECRIANIYTHLEKVIKDKIPSEDFFTGSDGIVGYGIINDNIPKQVNFGKNIILLNKLYYRNILSIKDKNLHAVEYLPNVKVSDGFVDIIFGMTKNKQPSKEAINALSTDEQHLLDTLLYISGIKSSSVSSNKDDIIKELKNKLRLAEGQIKAGNDNPVVKQELKDIIKKLYLYNVVSLKNSKEYLKQF